MWLSLVGGTQDITERGVQSGAGNQQALTIEILGKIGGAGVEMPGTGAGFAGDQDTGGKVPRRDTFVVGVQAATGHITEIKGGRAVAPDVLYMCQDRAQPAYQGRPVFTLVGKAGGEQATLQVVATAGLDRLSVEPGTLATQGGEGLAKKRGVDDAQPGLALLGPGNRHSHMAQAMREIDGAIDRVDDPERLGTAHQLSVWCQLLT